MADTTTLDYTTDHGALVIASWDWASHPKSGRWTRPQQCIKQRKLYIPEGEFQTRDTGFDVVRSRMKIRGKGEEVTFRFYSEEGKDFVLLGWSVPYTAEVDE